MLKPIRITIPVCTIHSINLSKCCQFGLLNLEFTTMISYMPPDTVANSLDACEIPEEGTQGESGANELELTVKQTPSDDGK